ncbi:3-oxoacyl-[acyl-carrier-protein] synthase-1 [Permianibacter aggregans]|uniref:3-oxoacyl-[acyl-carrier-protein] synthase-1 n=2 Tax=Permianibacter aggregans TaxID=1510150 RepID=A0A4R6UG96_9GAMM|nr:3-oxoacyl-[acyl-carrier-protein] synthase-1 [Permianibacter aggregans]
MGHAVGDPSLSLKMIMSTAVYLSEPGIVSPLGATLTANAEALFAGKRQLMLDQDLYPGRRVRVGRASAELLPVPESLREFDCRNNQLLLTALQSLLPVISELKTNTASARIGVVIGSSTSGISAGEQAIAQQLQNGERPKAFNYRQQEIGTPALFVARYLELNGPALTISTACTSSTQAFISARALIEADLCDAVVVGGADSLCQLTIQGFSALESYSENFCQPFAQSRDGINIGEGAIVFILGKSPTPYRLLGAGASSDAHHISAPHPEGVGAEQAIHAALADAGLSAEAIDYVNLHGTATPKNDEMEAAVMHRVFGGELPCSSTKSLTGHMLGAAGAMEVAACLLALKQQQLPVQTAPMPYDPVLPALNLVTVPSQATLNTVMSTNYAFGGSNVALILQRA